ncbi:MAG TPA: hypothetical protein VJ343_02560 [archaeon]|nr:hypothetical protein [archaeon]
MEILGNPINVIAEGIGREKLKEMLKSERCYTDFGMGNPFLCADQVWRFINTPHENQLHVRMWRRQYPTFNPFLDFIQDLYEKITGRELIKRIYCSPHYEPGYENPEHKIMLAESKPADYSTGGYLFGKDLLCIGFEYVGEKDSASIYRIKEK